MNTMKLTLSRSHETAQWCANALPFLYAHNDSSVQAFATLAGNIYKGSLDVMAYNGHRTGGDAVCNDGRRYFSLVMMEKRHLTDTALNVLGQTDSLDFPYHYAVSFCEQDKTAYLVSFKDKYCPNWNNGYLMVKHIPLSDVAFPILKADCPIYKIEDALHLELNRHAYMDKPMFFNEPTGVKMTIHDQHGNFITIEGATKEDLFKDFADNYTGYKNFRNPSASEWVICDTTASALFDKWKQTAHGLKSDFDKFYQSGIVD